MGALDSVKFNKLVKLLGKNGFSLNRQKGSHATYTKPDCPHVVTLVRAKEVKLYAVKQVGEVLNLTPKDLLKELKKC